jgi:hypothetical protein
MAPPLRPEADQGYFEYLEGGTTDSTASGTSLFGDTDDALLFTTRSKESFVGRYDILTIESKLAEVAYFVMQDGPVINATTTPPEQLYTLYRRVMLIAPAKAVAGFSADTTETFYDDYDVSARVQNSQRVGNTLGDLTKPENRFRRNGTTFPFRVNTGLGAFTGPRIGDDVLLTNVLAFDVQVFDPLAPIFVTNGIALEPHDKGWKTQAENWAPGYPPLGDPGGPVALGAYVDLGYGEIAQPDLEQPAPFALAPNPLCGSTARPYCYDTWSLHYENDGLDQNGDSSFDLGTNGVDDNTNGVVDDSAEWETSPPYPAPLRGIRVTIRVYEPSSKQVRESVIVQDF